MFNLSQSQIGFIAGVAALWILSALAGALPAPTDKSSLGYNVFYKFFKTIVGDLGSVFGKYLPPAGTGALIALLCISLCVVPVVGCTTQQKISVAQEIVNLGPQVQSTVDVVLAVLPSFDPPLALAVVPITAGWDLVAKGIVAAANDYLANPNQTNLAYLQAEVVKFQQSVNGAVLTAAGIKNSSSQALAMAVLGAVAIAVNAVLGLVQSISTKSQIVAMSKNVHVTLAQIRPYLDQAEMQLTVSRIQHDMSVPGSITPNQFFAYEAQAGF